MTPHPPTRRALRALAALLTGALVVLPLTGGRAAPAPSAGVSTSPLPSAAAVGTAAAVPAACASDGDYVWTHLHACGWPGLRSTGPKASKCPDGIRDRGTRARSVIRIGRAGAVVSCQRILGCLSIEARNVTIRDVKVTCHSGRTGEAANGTGVIKVQNGASATIRRVLTDGRRGVHACVWHQGTSLVVGRLDCRRVNDGIFGWADTGYSQTTGDNFRIKNSYFHNFTTRTANGHVDGYQTVGSAHGVIRHNTYKMTSDDNNSATSAVAIWNGRRTSRDIVVRDNLIAGGGFSIYAHDYHPSEASPEGGHKVLNTRFIDNVFSQRLFGCVGYYGVWFPRGSPTDGWNRSGNRVLETGQRIDGRNPTYGGRTCT
ncbi:right-handed parallel beta-helix repeat-containing protein [Nocardioides donggukensis]|uniref:Right-handed parallel beta-helix repeat-containing protein n=1 Tax=Nocardioides donggukensis TaxID=2774019 RepID=A0A927K5T8_9ACTN|nr:hypothetical protein [Nocardioides donggukensis]MBD8869675.1 hypothetical protein [Nocardioides donggukensis]